MSGCSKFIQYDRELQCNLNAGNKQKGHCDLSLSHASSASLFENNSRYGDGGGTDQTVQKAIFGKKIEKAVFGSYLTKLKQETRSITSRVLSKEEIDFLLLMVLAFHEFQERKVISCPLC